MVEITEVRGIIYKITCIPEDKCYVGQTLTHRLSGSSGWIPQGVKGRFEFHWKQRSKRKTLISDVLKKYDKSDFKIEVIAFCDGCKINELDVMETQAIMFHNTQQPNGYNFNRAGSVNSKAKKLIMEHYGLEPIAVYQPEKRVKSRQIGYGRGVNKFEFFKAKDITKIEIVPIRNRGPRVLVTTSETPDRYRLMFPDLPEALEFCQVVSTVEPEVHHSLLDKPVQYKYQKKLDYFDGKTIEKVWVRTFKYPFGILWGVYVMTDDMMHNDSKKRIILGGRNCNGDDSRKKTIEFLNKLSQNYGPFEVDDVNVCNKRGEKPDTA